MAEELVAGLNIDGFSPAKLQQLNEFVSVFKKLEAYEGKSLNPMNGDGLAAFNSSAKQTNELLNQINIKLGSLDANASKFGSSVSSGMRNAKQSTSELSNAVASYEKEVKQAADSSAKLASSTSNQAKESASLKVQLQEVQRALSEEAKANNAAYQARLREIESRKNAATVAAQQSRATEKIARESAREELNQANAAAKEQLKIANEKAKAAEKIASSASKEEVKIAKQKAREETKIADEAAKEQVKIANKLTKEKEAAIKQNAREANKLASQTAAEEKKALRETEQAQKQQTAIAQRTARENIKALNQQERAAAQLTDRHAQLKNLLKSQQNQYVNNLTNLGKDNPETKKSLADVQRTQEYITGINNEMRKADSSATRFGTSLTKGLSTLRLMAYILPGIGLAGIFNLGFEAIGNVIDKLHLFENKIERVLRSQMAFNQAQLDFLKLTKDYESTILTDVGTHNQGFIIEGKYDESMNKSKKDLLDIDLKLLELRRNKSLEKFKSAGTLGEYYRSQIAFKDASDDLIYAKGQVAAINKGQDELNPFGTLEDERARYLEGSQLRYDLKKEEYERFKRILEKSAFDTITLKQKELEIDEFNKKESLSKTLEYQKTKESIIQSNNKKILADDDSMLDDRLKAIKSNYESEQRLIIANLTFQTSQSDAYNKDKSATSETIKSQKAAQDAQNDSRNKYLSDVEKVTEDYRQKDLTAVEKMDKIQLEASAETNERLFRNNQKSLTERLFSYSEYLKKKLRIEDVEASRELDVKGLTDKQKDSIGVNATEKKKIIRASSERAIYEIVSTNLDEQLREVDDNNELREQSTKQSYAKELINLNTSFSNNEISWREYLGRVRRLQIDNKIKQDITDKKSDAQSILDLQSLIKKEEEIRDESKNKASNLSDGADKNDELAKVEASEDAIRKAKKKQQELTERVAARSLNEAQQNSLKLQEAEQDFFNLKQQLADASFDFVRRAVDRETEYKLDAIQREQQIRNEAFEAQKTAVESSSLDAKNKAALEIQISQQQRELNKQAAIDERKIKREQAILDRDLQAAQIIQRTASAVIGALDFYKASPLAFAIAATIGAIGAVQLATVLSTSIPAYEEGTKGVPHPGGYARTGEKGKPEIIKEPYKSPYIVMKDNISYLPKGTEVIPISDVNLSEKQQGDGWEQFIWLANQMKKGKREKTIVKNEITINVDQSYRKKILGN